MGRHGAKQQRKLAKKKAKREDKHNRIARLTSNDPTIRLADADRWPIVDSLVPVNLWEAGLGQLIFSRECPDGKIACSVFLVDVFCLGVKNAFWRVMPRSEYDKLVDQIQERQAADSKKVPPEYFSKLVHCAADYAQSLGFAAHSDFRHARLLLQGIDPSLSPDEIYFGKDGKPFYIRGPHESREKSTWIANRIQELGGHSVVLTDGFDGLADDEFMNSGDDLLEDFDDEELDAEDSPLLEHDSEESHGHSSQSG